MFKSILRSAPVQNTLALLLSAYMAFVKRTTRWTIEGRENAEPFFKADDAVILCVWHGRFLIANAGWPRRLKAPSVLISKSNDGDFISKAVQGLGLGVIRGSTSRKGSDKDRGGSGALRDMVRFLRKGNPMVITPDGPRGPRMRTGNGPIGLAKLAGVPTLGYGISVRNRIVFKSWDRFVFPLPFGRGAIVYTEPLSIDRRASEAQIEASRALLETRLITANMRADAIVGKEIIEPSDTEKLARI